MELQVEVRRFYVLKSRSLKITIAPTKNLYISSQISEFPKPRLLDYTATHQAQL